MKTAVGTHWSRDKVKELVQNPRGHKTICASGSRVHKGLFPVKLEVKERSRRNLYVVFSIPLDRGEGMGLALELTARHTFTVDSSLESAH